MQDHSISSQKRQEQGGQNSSGEGSEGCEEDMEGGQPTGVQDGAVPAAEAVYGKSMLTKSDLEDHFAYSLTEAARRLGVSNTTVKRACRQNFLSSLVACLLHAAEPGE